MYQRRLQVLMDAIHGSGRGLVVATMFGKAKRTHVGRNHMKKLLVTVFTFGLVSAMGAAAGTFTTSSEPPAVGSLDMINLVDHTGTFKWFTGDPVQGQTFTTGDRAVRFRAVTYRTSGSAPTKTFIVRIGTVVGTTFTEIHSETILQEVDVETGAYSTWALQTPVELQPNTTYGVDVGLTQSTSAWQTGIPYLRSLLSG